MKENFAEEKTTPRESVATNCSAWSDTSKIIAIVIRRVSVNSLVDANIVSVAKNCRKSSVEECIFDYIALHIKG